MQNLFKGGRVLNDGEVVVDLESRIKIIDVTKQAKTALIIAHSPTDYHSDHVNVSKLVFEATYLVCVKLWQKTSFRMACIHSTNFDRALTFVQEYKNPKETMTIFADKETASPSVML
jgi:LmbE family N-acetylglucosaminyl deacetylase